jgi:hypothetical protein
MFILEEMNLFMLVTERKSGPPLDKEEINFIWQFGKKRWVNFEGETRQAFEKPDGDWKNGRKWRPTE